MTEDSLAPNSTSPHDRAISDLEVEFGELFGRMRRLYAAVAHSVDPRMHPGHYKIFSTIGRGDAANVSSMAESLHIDKAQVSRAVRELEDFGLVARLPNPADGRASILSLSPLGAERLALVRSPDSNSLVQPLKQWDVADINHLTRLLRALTTSQRPHAAEGSATMD